MISIIYIVDKDALVAYTEERLGVKTFATVIINFKVMTLIAIRR